MADDMPQNDKGQPEEEEQQPKQEDFGALTEGEGEDDTAGNLPPLSSLDSSADSGFDSDMSLPPLGSLDFESSAEDSSGGLPPVEELSVQEPTPTGGAIKPPPPGFEAARRGEGPETEPATPAAESGFQDLSADSHFPEVSSEISPGPDSDMETPMFDSAFGGDDINLGGERPLPPAALKRGWRSTRGRSTWARGKPLRQGAPRCPISRRTRACRQKRLQWLRPRKCPWRERNLRAVVARASS